MTTAPEQAGQLDTYRLRQQLLITGVAALVLCVPAAVYWPDVFFRSYLVAYTFWLGIALGSLAVALLHNLTGGAWGFVIRRLLEGASRTLPLMLLLFVPIVLGMQQLYPWARPEAQDDPHLQQKIAGYLNVPFFLVRVAIYFTIWLGSAYLLNWFSAQRDRSDDPELARRARVFSAPALGLYGLAITFASIDWVMSLEPQWYSTIYGVLFGVGQVLSAFAFVIALVILLAARPPLAGVLGPNHLRDLGSLLLAFVMLWAYMALSQFLLIYAGNLPEETPWYLKRMEGSWEYVGMALIFFHFILPFLALLSGELKRDPPKLAVVAGVVLVMRFVDLFWLIVPAATDLETADAVPGIGFLDIVLSVAAVIGLGGVWMWVFLWQLGKRSLLPAQHPATEATHHA